MHIIILNQQRSSTDRCKPQVGSTCRSSPWGLTHLFGERNAVVDLVDLARPEAKVGRVPEQAVFVAPARPPPQRRQAEEAA